MDPKVKSIIAHITPIGWIIAIVLNASDRDETTSFYLKQTLGIYLVSLLISVVPVIDWLLQIVVFAFWLLSLIYAIQEQQKTIPLGEYFQEWFKGL